MYNCQPPPPCRNERKSYHRHRQKARSQSHKYLCLIIDGMDQNKTNLPCLRKAAKSTSGLYRLRTHLTGVLNHTSADHGKQVFVFVDILQWPHDSNLTLSIINKVLYLHMQKNNGSLPPVFYLQMDNTSRENKNKFVLGYLCFLVQVGIFRKVCIILTIICDCFRITTDKNQLSPCGTHSRGCGSTFQSYWSKTSSYWS